MFPDFFTSLRYWVLMILVILSVWGEIHGSLGGLELKIGEVKSEMIGPRPPRLPEPLKKASIRHRLA